MYHVAVAVAPEDDQIDDKVSAIADLPGAAASVRATVVHFHDGDGPVSAIPAVAETVEALEAAGVECAVYDSDRENAAGGLVEVAEALAVDLLCIGGRHRSPAGKLQLRTGAQEVVLRAPVPVLVAGELESREPRT